MATIDICSDLNRLRCLIKSETVYGNLPMHPSALSSNDPIVQETALDALKNLQASLVYYKTALDTTLSSPSSHFGFLTKLEDSISNILESDKFHLLYDNILTTTLNTVLLRLREIIELKTNLAQD